MGTLYDLLKAYGESDAYPFHMPGHKRQIKDFGNPFEIDITEIHEKPAFCRNIGGGFTLIIWETVSKCKREIRDSLAAGVLCYRLTFESSSLNTQSAAQCHW